MKLRKIGKKANLKIKLTVGVLLTIIGIIILVNFVQGTMSPYQSASDDLRRTPCTEAGGFWNTTDDGQCQVNSTNATVISNFTEFSLAPLYARQTGVIPLVLLAAVLLVAVLAVFVFFRMRN